MPVDSDKTQKKLSSATRYLMESLVSKFIKTLPKDLIIRLLNKSLKENFYFVQ